MSALAMLRDSRRYNAQAGFIAEMNHSAGKSD